MNFTITKAKKATGIIKELHSETFKFYEECLLEVLLAVQSSTVFSLMPTFNFVGNTTL